ncbi:MAG: ferrous iron transport protein B [Gemmatimonadota bacterium]
MAHGRLRVALVGAPNVGKSALFNRLTGAYVHVSNYPGTSVDVTRGSGTLDERSVEVLDTPGMYSLLPTTEEERVAQAIVLSARADVLVHVVDAKNLGRMLSLTLQLLEVGRPLVLAVNMMDEADRLGVEVDAAALRARLGIPVVPMAVVKGRGMSALSAAILQAAGNGAPEPPAIYGDGVGAAVTSVRQRLLGAYPVARDVLAALLLQGDAAAAGMVREEEPDGGEGAVEAAAGAAAALATAPAYRMAYERQRMADHLLEGALRLPGRTAPPWSERLGRMLSRPLVGIPFLLVVLYLGLYQFVGVFGAGTVVNLIETSLFEARINPFFERLFAGIPWESVRSLYVGEYGLLTLGLRYAVAIVLPVVGSFFLFFSVLEDSGYFPRLALLVDRVFKRIGLSGRAVIPMVLGFACDTMATMVTRTLETRRERFLATLLLALAIPCSAQLGVIIAVLAGHPAAMAVWASTLVGVFLLVGWLSSRVLPGRSAAFHMVVPPLRVPRPGNVLAKTVTRMHWYFLEVLPLFLLASILIWLGSLTGLMQKVLSGLEPLVAAIGLPESTATIFLFGFFRRDYGAAGLFDLNQAGTLDVAQLTVAAVTLTLFVPCVAQFLMMIKERGVKTALGMLAFITPFAFGVGYALNLILRGMGW